MVAPRVKRSNLVVPKYFVAAAPADGGDGSRRSSSSRRTKGEEMMTRFQMKQFMQAAQAQRDPDRAWFMIAEKVAFVMNTALATEMQAGRMCSEIR